jgi:undecaprenyl-diphosphatase
MNQFDVAIVSFLNSFARRSHAFDTLMSVVESNYLIKGGVVTALLWWVWFQSDDQQDERRGAVLSGVIACIAAIVAGRTLALTLPFRERPLRNLAFQFRTPYGVDEHTLIHWSSFPSDHAALFFALATSIFFVSRRAGILAYVHALFVVCFTRIYLGFHYPTDILAGALLGIGIASLFNTITIRKTIAKPTLRWLHGHPASFYASFFLLTSQISVMFDPLRQLGRVAIVAVKAALKH